MAFSFCLRAMVLTTAAAVVAADCYGEDWIQFREKCYWVSDYAVYGYSVADACRNATPHGEPASIHDLDLDAFIGENLTKGYWAWIGLYRADTNASWTWQDGSYVNFTMWYEDEPNALGEACGSINYNYHIGFWTDENCDTYDKIFVCQTNAIY